MVSIYRLKPDSREQHRVLGPQHPHVTQPTPMSLRNSLIITPARHQGEWGVSLENVCVVGAEAFGDRSCGQRHCVEGLIPESNRSLKVPTGQSIEVCPTP